MAEDFAEQFALGDDEHIATVDADGVAFAAIQALAAENDEKDDRIDELEAEAANAREEAANAREENTELKTTVDNLTARLAAVEARLDSADTD